MSTSSINLLNPESVIEAVEEGIQQENIEDQLKKNKIK